MRLTIDKLNYKVFKKKLSQLNKKLAKYDQQVSVLSLEEKETIDEVERKIYHFYDIEISEPEIRGKQNVVYKGFVSYKDGHQAIFSVDEDVVLGNIIEERNPLTCEHCHINRYRNIYYFFEEEGYIKSIGSTCVNEYFGHDIESALRIYSNSVKEINDEDSVNRHGLPGVYLDELIHATGMATDHFTKSWTSKANSSSYVPATVDVIKTIIFSRNNEVIEEKIEYANQNSDLAEKVKIELEEKYSNLNPKNDFEFNLKESLLDNNGNLRNMVTMIGVVAYVIWKLLYSKHTTELKESIDYSLSEHVGSISNGIEFDGKLIKKKEISSFYGYATIMYVLDTNDNIFKGFVNEKVSAYYTIAEKEVGTQIHVKGKVKNHEEDKYLHNSKVTTINYIKVS